MAELKKRAKFAARYGHPCRSALNEEDMDELPSDVMMLFSVVNMKLRDYYDSLDELCASMDVDRDLLEKRLAEAGFEYNPELNKFW